MVLYRERLRNARNIAHPARSLGQLRQPVVRGSSDFRGKLRPSLSLVLGTASNPPGLSFSKGCIFSPRLEIHNRIMCQHVDAQ